MFARKYFKKINSFYRTRISHYDIIIVFRQLTTLIHSNIPILQSIELLNKTQKNLALKNILLEAHNELQKGIHLSTSLKRYPLYFDSITCHLLMIGEASGTFPWILEQITHQKEKNYQLKIKIIHALFYPALIAFIAMIVFFIMLIFIVPRFNQFFQEMHTPLPLLTLYVIDISNFLRTNSIIFLLTLLFTLFFIKSYPNIFKLLSPLKNQFYKIPFYNNFKKNIAIVHFTRYLSITLRAGLPLNEAILLISKTGIHHEFELKLQHLKTSIEKGEKICNALHSTNYFPDLLIGMIKIGEETGMLDQILEKTSILYENEINRLMALISDLLEPLIMVILGVLIGTLIIALYLPIFNLGTLL